MQIASGNKNIVILVALCFALDLPLHFQAVGALCASRISGWAIIRETLSYPSHSSYRSDLSRIITRWVSYKELLGSTCLCMRQSIIMPMPKFNSPGVQAVYPSLHIDTSQDILARAHIHASLHPDQTVQISSLMELSLSGLASLLSLVS